MPPILIYLVVCLLIGILGRRTLFGFWGSLFASMLFTPLPTCMVLLLIETHRHPAED